jgi:hypothetical protein
MGKSYRADAKFEKYKKRDKKPKGKKGHVKLTDEQDWKQYVFNGDVPDQQL